MRKIRYRAFPKLILIVLSVIAIGTQLAAGEALLQSHALPPVDEKTPTIIIDGKSYTVHKVTDSYYDWLVSEGLVSPSTALTEDSILIVDPDTSSPITDLQTLERALLVRYGGLWLKTRDRSQLLTDQGGIRATQLKHGATDLLVRIGKPLARFTVSLAVTQNPLRAAVEAAVGTIVKDYILEVVGGAGPEELFRVITGKCMEHMVTAFEKGLAVQQSLASGAIWPDNDTLETAQALDAWTRQNVFKNVYDIDYLAWESAVYGLTDTIIWAVGDAAARAPLSYGAKLVTEIEESKFHKRFEALVSDIIFEFASRGIEVPNALEELVEDIVNLEAFLALVKKENIMIRTLPLITGHYHEDVISAVEEAAGSMLYSLEEVLWCLKDTVDDRKYEVAKNIALAETDSGEEEAPCAGLSASIFQEGSPVNISKHFEGTSEPVESDSNGIKGTAQIPMKVRIGDTTISLYVSVSYVLSFPSNGKTSQVEIEMRALDSIIEGCPISLYLQTSQQGELLTSRKSGAQNMDCSGEVTGWLQVGDQKAEIKGTADLFAQVWSTSSDAGMVSMDLLMSNGTIGEISH